MIDDALSYDVKPGALLIAPPDATAAAEAIALAGARIQQHNSWADAAAAVARPLQFDLLVLEATGVAADVLDEMLPLLDREAQRHGARIVVALDVAQIDTVSTHLFGRHVQLLCQPSTRERVAALTLAGAMRLDAAVGEIGGDAEAARLRRLNEEVARIAETLARLTREDGLPERPGPSVGDRRNGYGAPPAGDVVGPHDLRQAIRARRLRGQFFDPTLLEDPAWDMLLDLFAAGLEHRSVSVSSLCIAAAVPPTTALRWIGTMHEAGLFERRADPSDRRRAYIGLSQKGLDGMRAYVGAAKRAGLTLA